MDEAALQKCRRYKKACEKAGWDFMPFAADTFGALRGDARSFVSSVIHRKTETFPPMELFEVGQAVWSAVSGAAVQRAATQLSRVSILDCHLDMPLRVLDLRTAPGVRQAGAEVPHPLEEDVLVDMGLSQNPLSSLPCVTQQQKGPSVDAMDATSGNEEIEVLYVIRYTYSCFALCVLNAMKYKPHGFPPVITYIFVPAI